MRNVPTASPGEPFHEVLAAFLDAASSSARILHDHVSGIVKVCRGELPTPCLEIASMVLDRGIRLSVTPGKDTVCVQRG